MGRWRGPRTPADPALTTTQWRKDRKHWQALRLPCARCGRPIDYDGPRYMIVAGKRRQNARYLIVGHIVGRYDARRMGWSEDRIHARANQQPECQRCSNRSGARLGQRVQSGRGTNTPLLDECRRW